MIHRNGFTIMELIVVMALIGLVAAIAIPGFARWFPRYRLKTAATDLYSNMHFTKMGAIKAGSDWAIVFNAANDSYRVCSDDGDDGDWDNGNETVERSVNLADYGSGVCYGSGNATDDVPGGGAAPADFITYGDDDGVFNFRGTCNAGYVYLENSTNTTTYAVGTRSTGVILLRTWTGAGWE